MGCDSYGLVLAGHLVFGRNPVPWRFGIRDCKDRRLRVTEKNLNSDDIGDNEKF